MGDGRSGTGQAEKRRSGRREAENGKREVEKWRNDHSAAEQIKSETVLRGKVGEEIAADVRKISDCQLFCTVLSFSGCAWRLPQQNQHTDRRS